MVPVPFPIWLSPFRPSHFCFLLLRVSALVFWFAFPLRVLLFWAFLPFLLRFRVGCSFWLSALRLLSFQLILYRSRSSPLNLFRWPFIPSDGRAYPGFDAATASRLVCHFLVCRCHRRVDTITFCFEYVKRFFKILSFSPVLF